MLRHRLTLAGLARACLLKGNGNGLRTVPHRARKDSIRGARSSPILLEGISISSTGIPYRSAVLRKGRVALASWACWATAGNGRRLFSVRFPDLSLFRFT